MATPTRPWSVKGIGEPVRNIARRQAQATGMPIGRWIDQAIQRRLVAPADDALLTVALGELAAKVATSEQNIEAAFRPLLRDLRGSAARVVAAVEDTDHRPACCREAGAAAVGARTDHCPAR